MNLCPFLDINGNDVIKLIMMILEVKDLLCLGATCRKMRVLSKSENLWAYLLYREYGIKKHPIADNDTSSRQVYFQETKYEIHYDGKIDFVLFCCCLEGSIEGVKHYLRRGANVNVKFKESPLMIAAAEGFAEIVELLLRMEADPHFTDSNDETALIRCSRRDGVDVAKLLLDAGADINKTNNNGQTALMIACIHKRRKLIDFFVDMGADTNIVDNEGMTASAHFYTLKKYKCNKMSPMYY
jgi:ankyrin repeat protein